jgi:ribosomal protein S18 acetylase RimI-like enzyme
MHIRRAVDADAAAIAVVHVRSWQGAFPGLIPQSYLDALRPEDRLEMWHEALAATAWPSMGTFVAVSDGNGEPVRADQPDPRGAEDAPIVGFVCLGPSRDAEADPRTVGEIYTIYLDPAAWGSGVGVLLHDAALAEMRLGSYRRATLWTLGTNERARHFYERHGWHADGGAKTHDWGAFVATDVRYGIDLG